MTDRYTDAVNSLELAAASAMRSCRCAAARRAVRDALAELRTARLVARETQQAAAPVEKPAPPEPPAGHPAARPLQVDAPPPARSGYLGVHRSMPPGDE